MDDLHFSRILRPENVAVGLAAGSRDEVLRALVDLLSEPAEGHREKILESVLEREAIQTTGIGFGIAIPHGKADIDAPILGSVALTREPVECGSVDGKPARIFILMVSRPDVVGPHVEALAHVARLLGHRRVRETLLSAETPEDVVALFRGEEE